MFYRSKCRGSLWKCGRKGFEHHLNYHPGICMKNFKVDRKLIEESRESNLRPPEWESITPACDTSTLSASYVTNMLTLPPLSPWVMFREVALIKWHFRRSPYSIQQVTEFLSQHFWCSDFHFCEFVFRFSNSCTRTLWLKSRFASISRHSEGCTKTLYDHNFHLFPVVLTGQIVENDHNTLRSTCRYYTNLFIDYLSISQII
jgi:hypothetical protein